MSITEQGGFGAAATPEQWARFVLDHLAHKSVVLASGATLIETDAKQVHVPRITGDGEADWYEELEEIKDDAPEGDDLVLTPRKVAKLVELSNESVADSDPKVLDGTGMSMMRVVSLTADRAMFTGAGGKAPTGILVNESVALPSLPGEEVDYAGIVRGAGSVRQAGGTPDSVYVAPADYTELELATDKEDRPLLQPATDGPAPTVAGLWIWPTPALEAGEALVAEARQIVVALRRDASVEISDQALFKKDGTVARVIARLDVGINDADGLCIVGGSS